MLQHGDVHEAPFVGWASKLHLFTLKSVGSDEICQAVNICQRKGGGSKRHPIRKPVETAPVADLGAVRWGLKEMGRLDEIHRGLKSKRVGFRTTKRSEGSVNSLVLLSFLRLAVN